MTSEPIQDNSVERDLRFGGSAVSTTVIPKSFEYLTLEATYVDKLRLTTLEISDAMEKGWAVSITVGRHLIKVKKEIGHGNFELWLDTEFGMSERTARNFMTHARLIESLSKDKTAIIADLPATALYRLGALSTPRSVVDEVISMTEAGEIPRVADINRMIVTANDGKKRARDAGRVTQLLGQTKAEEAASEAADGLAIHTSQDAVEKVEAKADDAICNVLPELSEIIALTEEQRKTYASAIGRMDETLNCLQALAQASPNYSLLFLLSNLVKDASGCRALICSLLNFCEHQKAHGGAEADHCAEQLAA